MLRSSKKKIYAVQVQGEDFWEPVTLTIEGHTVPMTAHSLGEAQQLAEECHRQHPMVRFRIVHYYVSGYSEERATYSAIPGLLPE